MRKLEYINDLNGLIKNVELVTSNNQRFFLETEDQNTWFLKNEEITFDEYFLIINERFPIANFNNQFVNLEGNTFSKLNTTYDQSKIVINNITTSKELLISKEFIQPRIETSTFNSVDEAVNIIVNFSNVKKAFLLHLEIFTSTKLIGIIPAIIDASDKESNFQRKYICSFQVSNLIGLNELVTFRAKTSFDTHISKQIKFSTFQNYSLDKMKSKN